MAEERKSKHEALNERVQALATHFTLFYTGDRAIDSLLDDLRPANAIEQNELNERDGLLPDVCEALARILCNEGKDKAVKILTALQAGSLKNSEAVEYFLNGLRQDSALRFRDLLLTVSTDLLKVGPVSVNWSQVRQVLEKHFKDLGQPAWLVERLTCVFKRKSIAGIDMKQELSFPACYINRRSGNPPETCDIKVRAVGFAGQIVRVHDTLSEIKELIRELRRAVDSARGILSKNRHYKVNDLASFHGKMKTLRNRAIELQQARDYDTLPYEHEHYGVNVAILREFLSSRCSSDVWPADAERFFEALATLHKFARSDLPTNAKARELRENNEFNEAVRDFVEVGPKYLESLKKIPLCHIKDLSSAIQESFKNHSVAKLFDAFDFLDKSLVHNDPAHKNHHRCRVFRTNYGE